MAPIALVATSSIVSNNFVANAPMSRTRSSTPSKTLLPSGTGLHTSARCARIPQSGTGGVRGH
eukprot:scaffold141169_cov136-Phaeocystis_antarctica.AAC.1